MEKVVEGISVFCTWNVLVLCRRKYWWGLPFDLFSQLLLQQLDSFDETLVRPILITLSVSGHDSEMLSEGDVILRISSIDADCLVSSEDGMLA